MGRDAEINRMGRTIECSRGRKPYNAPADIQPKSHRRTEGMEDLRTAPSQPLVEAISKYTHGGKWCTT
jgi:hypothetical protein